MSDLKQVRRATTGTAGQAGDDVPRDHRADAAPSSGAVGDQERPSAAQVVREQSVRDLLQVLLGSVVAPATLLSALLYYFGWVVTNAQASVFGLDESALGYSTRDYLLRSTGALFIPLGGILLLGVMWVWGHTVLSWWLERPERYRTVARLATAIRIVGAGTFAIGLVGVVRPSSMNAILPPLGFSLGIAMSAYAAFLRRRLRTVQRGRAAFPGRASLRALNLTMVGLLMALSLFWVIGDYAETVGHERALRAAARLASRPSVIVYSAKRLHIDGPGVRETELREPDSAERFRYSGLRLLFRANGKYFLVPEGWSPSNGVTIVLPDIEAFRLEFVRAAD
jgi:hypothetical protein